MIHPSNHKSHLGTTTIPNEKNSKLQTHTQCALKKTSSKYTIFLGMTCMWLIINLTGNYMVVNELKTPYENKPL